MRYAKVADGTWVQPRMDRYYMKCCDCGLVHRMQFRVVFHGKVPIVQFKPVRITRKGRA